MPTEIEEVIKRLRKEFSTGRQALSVGNDGMARVCARRAAGVAITFWLRESGRTGWGVDAMSQLRHLLNEPSFPSEVQTAATRLAAKVTPQSTSSSSDPLKFVDVRAYSERLRTGIESAGAPTPPAP